jgi:hypothetical protein
LTEWLGAGLAPAANDHPLANQGTDRCAELTVAARRLCRTGVGNLAVVSVRLAVGELIGLRLPSAVTTAWQRPATDLPTVANAPDPAVCLLSPKKMAPTSAAEWCGFGSEPKLVGRLLEPQLTERWPPKDGQPTPTLGRERLSMSKDRAPLASGRAAHADEGV